MVVSTGACTILLHTLRLGSDPRPDHAEKGRTASWPAGLAAVEATEPPFN